MMLSRSGLARKVYELFWLASPLKDLDKAFSKTPTFKDLG